MYKINVFNRTYQLKPKDIFCVNIEGFLANASLWSPSFQVVGTCTYGRKHWWQFWKPKKKIFVKIMYLGGFENESN